MAREPAEKLTPNMDGEEFNEALRRLIRKGDLGQKRGFIADALLARLDPGEDWVVCGQMAVTGKCRSHGDLDLVPRGFLRQLRDEGITDPAKVREYVETELSRVFPRKIGDPLLLTFSKDSVHREEGGIRLMVNATVDFGHSNKQVGELPVDVVLDPDTVSLTPQLAQWSFSGLTTDLYPDSAVSLQDVREVFAGKLCGAYVAATDPQLESRYALTKSYIKYLGDCAEILERKLVNDELSSEKQPQWLGSNLDFTGLDEVIAAKAAENGIDPRQLIEPPEIPNLSRRYRWRTKVVADSLYEGRRTCSYHFDLMNVRNAVDQALAGPMDSRPVLGRGPTQAGFGPMYQILGGTPPRAKIPTSRRH